MFLIFNKEKIQTYIVSILTVSVLVALALMGPNKSIQVSTTERLLPIYNVKIEDKKVAFTMNCAW